MRISVGAAEENAQLLAAMSRVLKNRKITGTLTSR
jgi:histidinol-phosphate/aromatic aminotransferase/cobyric acid decarboxylase-like protein